MIDTLALVLSMASTDTVSPRPAARDPWLGADKVKHGVFAFALQSSAYAAVRLVAPHRESIAAATAFTLTLSVLKERSDRGRTGFSVRDLVWDAAGIAVASVILSQSPQR